MPSRRQQARSGSPLTTAAIVDAGIDLADADGLDALSMRRLADRLGVAPMSLYRHVDTKDQLLAAMTEEIGDRYPYPPVVGTGWTWRDRVRVAGEVDWELYREHPWVVLAYAVPRYAFGPSGLACLAWLVEGFTELGVTTAEAADLTFVVWSQISGAALPLAGRSLFVPDPGTSSGDGLAGLLDGRVEAPDALLDLVGGSWRPDPQRQLRQALEALCDGLEQQIGARAAQPRS